jgi:hypothetical protein
MAKRHTHWVGDVSTGGPVCIGLRVKTGKAIAVMLCGPAKSPVVIKRGELLLADNASPDTWQPFHVVMELPWTRAVQAVKPMETRIKSITVNSLRAWAKEASSSGLELTGVALVVGSQQDPARIGNPHIRAHAAEGRLYREALEAAARAIKLPARVFVEDALYEIAARELRLAESELKERVSALGKQVGPPWRANEKSAAAAAWAGLGDAGRRVVRG